MDSIREEEKRFKQKEEEKFKKITDSSNLVTKTPIIIKDDEIEPSQIYKLNDTGLVEKLN